MLYFLAFVFVAGAFAENACPTVNLLNFYRELNCEPIYEPGSNCPTRFNCDKIETRVKDQCYYKGRAYSLGERIPTNETQSHCLMHCICRKDGESAAFTCAVAECPELWHRPKENCRLVYSPDECCSTGVHCLGEDPMTVTCHYNGKTYYEGERFYPEGESCKKCYCKPGFRGELVEPFCEPIDCSMELVAGNRLKDNCAPVFYTKDGCCPLRWICPSSAAKVIPRAGNRTATTSAKCRFGNLELNQFDVLEEGTDKCGCLYPPYVSCIEKEEEYHNY